MSRLFALLPLLASLLATPPIVSAQNADVRGTVTDARTGEPLASVNVGLLGTSYGAATGSDGIFLIEGVPAGRYTVVASSVGYETLEQPVTVPRSGEVTVNFAFTEADIELQEVEVVGRRATTYDASYSFAATKTATPIIEVPQSISVVTKEIIDEWISFKRANEVDPFRLRPTPLEFELYYDV